MSRLVRVDGAWGNITGYDRIQLAIFNERGRFPTSMDAEFVTENGELTQRIKQIQRDPTIRRVVEFEMELDVGVAKEIISLLERQVKKLEGMADE